MEKTKNQSRIQLKAYFKKGDLPTEEHFMNLIDSTFNKADDRLDIDSESGLMIYPTKTAKLISFFEDLNAKQAKWSLQITSSGISLNKKNESLPRDSSEQEQADFFINEDQGNVGIGTNDPKYKLDVDGIVASSGRVGNYSKIIKADGKWHNVFEDHLDNCSAFEVIASAKGEEGEGKYSLLHAIATSTFGNSKPKITKTCAHYGKSWHKLDIRWESRLSKISPEENKFHWWERIFSKEKKENYSYNLQIRTKSNYGKEGKIALIISTLWNDNFWDKIPLNESDKDDNEQ